MALFLELAELAEELAGEAGRLKKRAAIAGAIAAVHAAERDSEAAAPESEDAGLFALYLAGTPFAEADARKLNAGGALLSKALLAVSGASDAALTAAYRRHGDMGAAAFDLLVAAGETRGRESGGSDAGLKLAEVADAFAAMAVAKTTAIRAALVEGMLRRATPLEAKYLLKLMLGDMRIGVKQSLVEEAIAIAAGASVEAVRRAVMLEADLAGTVRRAFAGTLDEARMRLFHPLGFMLASPVETPEEAVERFTEKPGKVVVAKKPRRGRKGATDKQRSVDGGADGGERHIASDKQGHLPHEAWHVVQQKEGIAPAGAGASLVAVNDDEKLEAEADIEGEHALQRATHGVQAFLEDKYDGMRAQVHCGDAEQPGRVAIYSRNREDVTESFPELEEAFARVRPERDGALIFDGEILGWDLEQARALPFAVLGQRIGRKRVSNEWRQQVPVVFMAFDLMYAGGELLLELPLRERRNKLEAVVEQLVEQVVSPVVVDERARDAQTVLFAGVESAGAWAERPVERLMISPSRLVESAEDIDRAYAEARARANEGVMLKAAGSVYQPGRRGLAWVKLKRELATLDVVVTGAEFGHGKRAGILSDYTFAVRGDSGELLNVGKAYSGLTDAEIAEMSAWMMEHTLEDQGFFRTVEPLMVLEVAFNNIMRSGRHASGFAMRFPRILRIRTDKPVSEIDTVERVEEIYQSQVDKPVEA
jgi:DNA ligase-1